MGFRCYLNKLDVHGDVAKKAIVDKIFERQITIWDIFCPSSLRFGFLYKLKNPNYLVKVMDSCNQIYYSTKCMAYFQT